MGKLQDKVAVITGAGRGIGRAIAETFAAEGAKVAVVSRTEASSQAAAEAINAAHPGAAKAYAVDVADAAATAELGKAVLADFDHVDILVNNAGVTKDGLLLRMSDADWDFVVDTNLKGAFNMVKAVQRSILKQKGARIINVASVIGLIGNAGQANYAASKAGLIGFTKSLAREFAGRGVTANVIAPGFIATDMTGVLDEKVKAAILEKIPLGDFGQGADIAAAALFLASPEARYITGQVLAVDGGMVM
ncbi:MAG TPA: 3-oxoacyl-[acyl-carrier-protein] reductase [Prosthecobacter sp.]|nr:3-oxoacyl-[acyl-carrier-protein] reductase [Prosthecobacter sp.]HRK16973.1 3-oxoacyl-[acyl-carrier-protein] reductase [Prosthecobacter sp.]